MAKITFQITDDDIDNGVGDNLFECAAALCIKRSYPMTDLAVDIDYIFIKTSEGRKKIRTPDDLGAWIMGFDDWKKGRTNERPEPFTFELEI